VATNSLVVGSQNVDENKQEKNQVSESVTVANVHNLPNPVSVHAADLIDVLEEGLPQTPVSGANHNVTM
jgi:hypothetical protein